MAREGKRMHIHEHETSEYEVRGVWVRGEQPKELVLSDGSRLRLRAGLDEGEVGWLRTDPHGCSTRISTAEAAALAGREFRRYVSVRTRAEAEWLRTIAERCTAEASELDRGLAATG